jgi:hypothetical protein
MATFNSSNTKTARKINRPARKFTGLKRDDDPNTHNGLTVVYDEGSGQMIHKQHPDYYHVPAAAENVAKHYIRRHIKDGDTEEDHADAVRLFGISRNRNNEWHYDKSRSLIANTPTLGDDMHIPIQSKVWKPNMLNTGSFFKRGQKISDLIAKPEIICGFDPSGEWSQDVRDQSFHKDNCSANAHAPGCNIDRRMIGQYMGDNGNVYMAQPLKVMNEAQSFMRDGITQLLSQNKFDVPSYFDLMKSASQYIHGRFNKASDPTPDGRDYHGIQRGSQPWFGHNHINGLMNNVDDFYEIDPGRAKGKLHESFKRRLGELRTAQYVACFCPYCSIDGQKRLGSQWHDVQHHVATAKSSDPRVVDSFFHLEQNKKGNVVSQGFHLNDLPDDNGAMQHFGEVGKRTPHRVFFHDRDFAKTILHYARHNFDEKRQPSGYLRPRMMRVGNIVTRGFSLSPQNIADNLAINPEVSGSGE